MRSLKNRWMDGVGLSVKAERFAGQGVRRERLDWFAVDAQQASDDQPVASLYLTVTNPEPVRRGLARGERRWQAWSAWDWGRARVV
jgi:hypothetical protein